MQIETEVRQISLVPQYSWVPSQLKQALYAGQIFKNMENPFSIDVFGDFISHFNMEEKKVYALYIKLFALTDPLKSLCVKNRTYLRSVWFGAIDQKSIDLYNENEDTVEEIMPLSWLENDKTYFHCKALHSDDYTKYFD